MIESFRIAAFADRPDDDVLDRLIRIRPDPVRLGLDTAMVDADRLRKKWKGVFVPSSQIRIAIRRLLGYGRNHAATTFGIDEDYVRGLYQLDPWLGGGEPAVCVTGLAGVGKSELLCAIDRLVCIKDGKQLVSDHGYFPHKPIWNVTLKNGVGMAAMFSEHLGLESSECQLFKEMQNPTECTNFNKKFPTNRVLQLSRRLSWRDAAALLCADEMQFITHGSANTKATAVLLQLMTIGPRLVFCANYSMLHGLMRRNQQDTQRLLSTPIILHPDAAGSQDWCDYLTELQRVAPEALAFDVWELNDMIHQFTYGIRRLVVQLLSVAYERARHGGRQAIRAEDIRKAYCSDGYFYARKDIQTLQRQEIEGRMVEANLWCPFYAQERSSGYSGVVPLTSAVKKFEERIENDLLMASLLPNQVSVLRDMSPSPPNLEVATDPGQKVVRIKRKKATKESLINATRRFEER